MTTTLEAIGSEYRRYKAIGELAMEQLDESQLCAPGGGGLSVATIVWHMSGNLQSRFSDFLTTDGEKSWRQREEEFSPRKVSRKELLLKWEQGWQVLFETVASLSEDDLEEEVKIRSQPLRVNAALLRSVAHAAYHVGQIVWLAKGMRGEDWRYLSIAPGESLAYNQNPTREKKPDGRV